MFMGAISGGSSAQMGKIAHQDATRYLLDVKSMMQILLVKCPAVWRLLEWSSRFISSDRSQSLAGRAF
jgi:hypothetical protein